MIPIINNFTLYIILVKITKAHHINDFKDSFLISGLGFLSKCLYKNTFTITYCSPLVANHLLRSQNYKLLNLTFWIFSISSTPKSIITKIQIKKIVYIFYELTVPLRSLLLYQSGFQKRWQSSSFHHQSLQVLQPT